MRKTGAATVYFAYDEQGRLLGNDDSANRLQQETIYLGDLPVAVLTGDGTLVDDATTASATDSLPWSYRVWRGICANHEPARH